MMAWLNNWRNVGSEMANLSRDQKNIPLQGGGKRNQIEQCPFEALYGRDCNLKQIDFLLACAP